MLRHTKLVWSALLGAIIFRSEGSMLFTQEIPKDCVLLAPRAASLSIQLIWEIVPAVESNPFVCLRSRRMYCFLHEWGNTMTVQKRLVFLSTSSLAEVLAGTCVLSRQRANCMYPQAAAKIISYLKTRRRIVLSGQTRLVSFH